MYVPIQKRGWYALFATLQNKYFLSGTYKQGSMDTSVDVYQAFIYLLFLKVLLHREKSARKKKKHPLLTRARYRAFYRLLYAIVSNCFHIFLFAYYIMLFVLFEI